MVEPLTRDELWRLMHDARGRQLGPLTRIGTGVVMGFDPIRVDENLAQYGDGVSAATVYGQPGDRGTEDTLAHLRDRGVRATLRDTGREPLTADELWQLLEMPGKNIRTPFTDVDGIVVIGNDRRRLQEVLASRS